MKNASLEKIVSATEEAALRAALTKHKFNTALVMKELGVSRVTLWRKMKLYGLRRRVLVNVK